MIPQELFLVILVRLINRIPMPLLPLKRNRGHPKVYPDRLFLQALVIMIVRHLHKVHELLTVLDEPTAEMQTLRALITENRESFDSNRTHKNAFRHVEMPEGSHHLWRPDFNCQFIREEPPCQE